jgi:molecular chaperone GrpE
MAERDTGRGPRGTSGRLSSDKGRPAEVASGTPGTPPAPVDPELVDDLGEQLTSPRELDAELGVARADAARHLETAQRWQAEFENYRRRQTALAEEQSLRAGERVVERLIPAIDDLERAIDHAEAGGDVEHLLRGVEVVHAQILGVMGREGVEVIDPLDEVFDPNLHHAVSQREDTAVPDNTVIEVFQRGYRLHGRVLRPAMVVVSSGGPERKA